MIIPGRPQPPPGTSRGPLHMARSPAHGPRHAEYQIAMGVPTGPRSRSFVPPPNAGGQQPPPSQLSMTKSQLRPDQMPQPGYPPQTNGTVPSSQSLTSEMLQRSSPMVVHPNAPLQSGTFRSLPPNLLQGTSTGDDGQAAPRKQVPVSVEVVSSSGGGGGTHPAQRSSSLVASSAPPPRGQVYVPPPCPHRVPTIANVEHIEPMTVYQLLRDNQCLLIDLRGEDRAAGLIDGAMHIPAIAATPFTSRIPELVRQWLEQPLVVFTCQYSAHRAPQCANWYRQQAPPNQRVAILSGGFRGWEACGLPVSQLAKGEQAQVTDEIAMKIGQQFVLAAPMFGRGQPLPTGYQIAGPPGGVPVRPFPSGSIVATVQPPQRPVYVAPHCPNRVATIANVDTLDPNLVFNLLREQKCILVDLRTEDRAAGLIEGSIHEPAIDTVPFISKVPNLVQKWGKAPLVVFTCQYSAHRAPQCANWYRQKAHPHQRVAILQGGFRQWEAVGLPVQQLATGDSAQNSDEVAMQLGTQFVRTLPPAATQPAPIRHGEGSPAPAGQPLTGMIASSPVRRAGSKPGAGPTGPGQSEIQAPTQPQHKTSITRPIQSGGYVRPHLPNTVPTAAGVEHIEPQDAYELMKDQATLIVDLRGEDRAAGLIDGAVHEPAIDRVPFPTKVPGLVQQWADKNLVIFTCQYSAHRAPQCANWYREKTNPRQRVAILSGGFRNWEGVGLPVSSLARGADAKAADKVAMKLGTQFVDGCIAGVPGGGFCMPTTKKAE